MCYVAEWLRLVSTKEVCELFEVLSVLVGLVNTSAGVSSVYRLAMNTIFIVGGS